MEHLKSFPDSSQMLKKYNFWPKKHDHGVYNKLK